MSDTVLSWFCPDTIATLVHERIDPEEGEDDDGPSESR